TRSDMEPEETRNYEIGTKWNLLDDALSLTAAVFRTSKLKVGGGAFYVDEVFGNVDNTTKVDSYVRYDAMVSYEVNSNLDLQLNVQNLTDEVYFDKAYGTHFANQGAGRTVLLSTNVHF